MFFFSKKSLLKSLGLFNYFKSDFPLNLISQDSLTELLKSSEKFKLLNTFIDVDCIESIKLFSISVNDKPLGFIIISDKINFTQKLKSIILSLKFQLENLIKVKEIENKLIISNSELKNKLLEIESLIDVTDLIDNQQGLKEELFEGLLITIISILNSSKGMVLLKDEKSGFLMLFLNLIFKKMNYPVKY